MFPSSAMNTEGRRSPPDGGAPAFSCQKWESILIAVLPVLILAAGLTISYRSESARHVSETRRLRNDINAAIEPFCSELSRNVIAALHHSEGLAALVSLDGEPEPDRFRAFCGELLRCNSMIRNIALAPDNVVSQVYPLEGNERVIGLRYRDNPEQWPGVKRMMELKKMVVAGPVNLVQGGIGVIGRQPVYTRDPSEPGNERYWGLVSTVIDFNRLMAVSTGAGIPADIRVALRGADGLGAQGAVFWGDARLFERQPVLREIRLPTGSWQIAAAPAGGWPLFRPMSSPRFLAGAASSFACSALMLALLSLSCARRKAENELRKLNAELEERVATRTAELNRAMLKAQEADRLKSVFLATMSHELRTPLNTILGFTGVLLQGLAGPLNDEQRKQLAMARDSAKHLLALINDILDISRIEAGQIELSREAFDMRGVLESAMKSVAHEAQAKGIELSLRIGQGVGRAVGDRRRVEQVLLNLLSNAVKFTDRGSVTVECAAREGWIETAVRDTGIGIRAADMDKLFKPFKQIDSGANRRHEGTGLGLAISKNLAEMMGGSISVRSEWGKGSEFVFRFPQTAEGGENGADSDNRR